MNSNRPIIFVLTNDEETVMYGINRVVEFMKQNNISLKFAIIGEPSSCNFATSNMGFYEIETIVKGKACHSSNPQFGINSIYIMSKLITYIESLSKEYLSLGTTINVGIINGGTMCNIVAEKCSIRWDIRTFSKDIVQEIINKVNTFLKRLTADYDGSTFTNETIFKIPAFSYKKNEITDRLMKKYNINEKSYSAATEAGFYQELGADCVIFGCGDIKDCHAVDEKINKEEYVTYQQLLLNILKDVCQ
ncbi:MAG: M20/M25/M40 family metallo-hydrolase [Clostridia bacterium]|nr:M20/M25/M40 family metallo-hydrolase [Clostridia bacterium]